MTESTALLKDMHPAIAFMILMAFLAFGEFISVKTKAIVPSILIFLILLLSGVWINILPQDILPRSGFSDNLISVLMVIVVVNMGASLSVDALKKEWKTVIIGIGGIIAGKFLKVNWQMSFAIALNCLIGFPVNFLLTNEAIHAFAQNEEEVDYLSNTLVPTMLVGGFTSIF